MSRGKQVRELRRIVKALGLEMRSFEINGRGHVSMRISNGVITRTITTSATPSDWRTTRNLRGRMRREFLRQTAQRKD